MTTPQPTPPAPSPNERRPVDAAAARAHQVDAVLRKAEAKLFDLWCRVPSKQRSSPEVRSVCFLDTEVADLRILVNEIRAARGGQ